MPNSHKPLIWGILSDWGKVVVDFDNGATGRALLPHCLTPGVTAEWLSHRLFKDWRPLFDRYMCGEIGTSEFRWACRFVLALGHDCGDEDFDRAFADVFTRNEPIIALWEGLRGHHVRMVAASNLEELRHRKLIEMGIHELFDKHCLSYKEGVAKPDPEFFKRALSYAGTEPHETLFIDDHLEFCEVAATLGIHAEVYDIAHHDDFVRRLREGYVFA